MEPAPPFDLNALKRDWIEGVSGESFHRRVRRRLNRIQRAGPEVRLRGVLLAEKDPVRFAAAFFAAVYTRVPLILANPAWGKTEWGEVRNQVRPALVFGHAPDLSSESGDATNPEASTLLIPTGGSTGGVRFAVHRWESLAGACEGMKEWWGERPMHFCCVLPLYHVSGLMQLLRAFLSGGRIAFRDWKNMQLDSLNDFEDGEWCCSLVATQLRRLLEDGQGVADLARFRAIFVGGSAFPETLLRQAREHGLPLVLSYGLTETAAMVTALPPEDFLTRPTSAGQPLPHARIDILDAAGELCPRGRAGRIRVAGDSLFYGYHGRHGGVTQAGFVTDDEGFFDASGRLHVLGRMDRLVISGGEKIDPREVEAAILSAGEVEEVLVVGLPDSEWGQKLVGFYTVAAGKKAGGGLEAHLRGILAPYKRPKLLLQVSELPLNDRGKIDHQRMKQMIDDSDYQSP
ncbi:MAG: AMP-binding protein [Opitutales bacterium]